MVLKQMKFDIVTIFPDFFHGPLDYGIVHPPMRHVPPPEQHISLVDGFFGAALVGIVERAGGDGEFGEFAQVSGNCAVHAIGINLRHLRVLLFVPAFVPDQDAPRHGHLLRLGY